MIRFQLNGESREVDVDPNTPLLWVLRDQFNLLGTKYGCGIGQCGACTVLVNGRPSRSCRVLISEAEQYEVVTIEGLSADASHPVQQAWIEEDVPQCGYCQSGQILTAVVLLRDHSHPSDAEIDTAMTNICRCGTYPRIRRAIHSAAAKQEAR
ncbi:MAG: isoquinoline 1-oxidoreductase alpha subunit [Candidatus Pseudothioglobus sp.]|jgi:aerobic-type carbon monoxide dehydrogenase small subunit (CoxS/CutS family)